MEITKKIDAEKKKNYSKDIETIRNKCLKI